jgi:hypothetical protein
MALQRRVFERAHTARHRSSGELDNSSIAGDASANSCGCTDDPILADHCSFDYLAGRKADHKRDNRASGEVDRRDLLSGLEQNLPVFEMHGPQVRLKCCGIPCRKRGE